MRASSVVKRQSTRDHIPVALILPSIDLAAQDVLIGNPSVQALSSQHTDLYLRHIQPTPVFGSVVYLQSLSYTPRLSRLECLV